MRRDLSALSAANKIAAILEVIIVFLPVSLCLLINNRIGADHTVIAGDTVLLQGPIAYAGLAATLLLLWIATRRRGGGWRDYGLSRPKNWFFTVLMSLGVALGILGGVPVSRISSQPAYGP